MHRVDSIQFDSIEKDWNHTKGTLISVHINTLNKSISYSPPTAHKDRHRNLRGALDKEESSVVSAGEEECNRTIVE